VLTPWGFDHFSPADPRAKTSQRNVFYQPRNPFLRKGDRRPKLEAEVIMRLLSGIFLVIALLAGVLWLMAGTVAVSGIAMIVALLFLVVFIVSLFLKRGHPEEL
jgi:uncharacterized membrane protein YtjA (UPF0391 family)